MRKRTKNSAQIFKGATYVALKDADAEDVSIEFLHARFWAIVRFTLLESERQRYDDEPYIDNLIQSYHRDHGKFSRKRKVMTG